MALVKAKRGISGYGQSIGILVLDDFYPCIPGDVRNATTYSYPVTFKIVKGVTIHRVVYEPDSELIKSFIEAGKELVKEGARAITGDCGYLALIQKEMAAALPVPVFMSSLMQIPMVSRMLQPGQKVGIIAGADRTKITKKHLKAVGVDESMPVVVTAMENCEEFMDSICHGKGRMDTNLVEKEIVGVAKELVSNNPDIGAILLECSSFPPYAAAVQEATGLPVFDFITLINMVHQAVCQRRYSGVM